MSIIKGIEEKLRNAFSPLYLKIVNDSPAHAGHEGAVGEVSHVEIELVSETFAGMSRLERHRAIHSVLADEFKIIHSVRLTKALTPAEYASLPKTL